MDRCVWISSCSLFCPVHHQAAVLLLKLVIQQGQSPSIRQLIMHSMAEWYMRGEQYDQAKLSRILDVAQDLKVDFLCSLSYLK